MFVQEPPTEQIIFMNTGTGLSQHLCYLLSKKNQYPQLKYRMLFGVRNEAEIYAKEQLDQLKSELPNFDYEYVLSRPSENWKGKKGYIQHFLNQFEYKTTPTTFYLCGNGGMIKDVKNQLIEVEPVDKSRIWAEPVD